jgi:hypothetical protein
MGLDGPNSIKFGTKVAQNVADARINRPLDASINRFKRYTFIMIAIVIVIRYKIFNNYSQHESSILGTAVGLV